MIRKNKELGIRLPEERFNLIKRTAELRGEDMCDFMRRAAYRELARLSLLSEEEKKMLGVA